MRPSTPTMRRWKPSFQSTHPVRGATNFVAFIGCICNISIHAPRAGCDGPTGRSAPRFRYFNPRTPCGVRLCSFSGSSLLTNFNPRTPCGVRPLLVCTTPRPMTNFNPRTPCGVRRRSHTKACPPIYFNPRTPCGVRRLTLSDQSVML